MGAGRSIAVQGFNENACILGLGAVYSAMAKFHVSVFTTISTLGLIVAGTMWLVQRLHRANLAAYPDEVERLLAIARRDEH